MSKKGINLSSFNPSKAGMIGENTTGGELFSTGTPVIQQPQPKKKNDNISFIVRLNEDEILLVKYLARKKKISQSKVVAELLDKNYESLSQDDKDFMNNNKDLFV